MKKNNYKIRAVTAVSYGLLTALIIVTALIALTTMGTNIQSVFNFIGATTSNSVTTAKCQTQLTQSLIGQGFSCSGQVGDPLPTSPIGPISGAANQNLYGGMQAIGSTSGNAISYTIVNDTVPPSDWEFDDGACGWTGNGPAPCPGYWENPGYTYNGTVFSESNGQYIITEPSNDSLGCNNVINPFTGQESSAISVSNVNGDTVCDLGPTS